MKNIIIRIIKVSILIALTSATYVVAQRYYSANVNEYMFSPYSKVTQQNVAIYINEQDKRVLTNANKNQVYRTFYMNNENFVEIFVPEKGVVGVIETRYLESSSFEYFNVDPKFNKQMITYEVTNIYSDIKRQNKVGTLNAFRVYNFDEQILDNATITIGNVTHYVELQRLFPSKTDQTNTVSPYDNHISSGSTIELADNTDIIDYATEDQVLLTLSGEIEYLSVEGDDYIVDVSGIIGRVRKSDVIRVNPAQNQIEEDKSQKENEKTEQNKTEQASLSNSTLFVNKEVR